MTDIDIFRSRVGDRLKSTGLNSSGNGSDRQFDLQYRNISNLTVTVNGQLLVQDTDYTLDAPNGLVLFNVAPADGADIQYTFTYSAFSDDEVNDLLATFGRSGAVLEGLKMIMADAARLYNYSKGMNQSQRQGVFQNLKELYTFYMEHGVDGTANSVSIGKRHVITPHHRMRRRMLRDFGNGYLGS